MTDEELNRKTEVEAAGSGPPKPPQKTALGYSGTPEERDDIATIRNRPSLFIGDTCSKGFHWTINKLPELTIRRNFGKITNISLVINENGSVTFYADAALFSVPGLHEAKNLDEQFLRLPLGEAHTSFSPCLINALSAWMTVNISENGTQYRRSFRKGYPTGEIELTENGNSSEASTSITFLLDDVIFQDFNEDQDAVKIDISTDSLSPRLAELAYLNKGLNITLQDARTNNGPDRAESFVQWKFPSGISDFVKALEITSRTITTEPIYFSDCIYLNDETTRSTERIELECALSWSTRNKESLYSYCNLLNTPRGGTHLSALRIGLWRAITKYMDEKQLTLADVAEGLTAVISLHMPTPRFGDATLKQLCNDEIELHIQNVIETRLLQFLEQNKNAAHLIIQRMREAAQQRIQKLEEIAHSKISNSRLDLQNAATIAPCKSKLASDSELFIVLRDSCYTAAVNGRNPEFQAILPLERNIFAETEAATQNLQFISNCLGRIDELHELTINELRFQKIIIMLDEEDNPILRSLTKFFLNNHPLLIQEGLLYRAIPPRFKISKLKKTVYCFKDLRKEKFLEEFGGGATVDELRLGTLEARELWQTTMNPDARVLRQITNPDLVT